MTTATSDRIDGRTPKPGSPRRRWRAPLLAGTATVLLILASRTVNSDLTLFSTVTQRSCQEQMCVERVSSPDLLFAPGSRRVQVVLRDANGQTQPRMLVENDPFGQYGEVSIVWKDGGVSLSDTAAVLSWDAESLARLNS